MSRFKIVISDTVKFPVKGAFKNEEGKEVPFKFSLTCARLSADQVAEVMSSTGKVADELSKVVKDWHDQRLVLEQDGTPALFGEEAFAALMSIPHMALMCFNAFHQATGATAKN